MARFELAKTGYKLLKIHFRHRRKSPRYGYFSSFSLSNLDILCFMIDSSCTNCLICSFCLEMEIVCKKTITSRKKMAKDMTKFEVNLKPNNLAIETGIQSKIEIIIRTKPIIIHIKACSNKILF